MEAGLGVVGLEEREGARLETSFFLNGGKLWSINSTLWQGDWPFVPPANRSLAVDPGREGGLNFQERQPTGSSGQIRDGVAVNR